MKSLPLDVFIEIQLTSFLIQGLRVQIPRVAYIRRSCSLTISIMPVTLAGPRTDVSINYKTLTNGRIRYNTQEHYVHLTLVVTRHSVQLKYTVYTRAWYKPVAVPLNERKCRTCINCLEDKNHVLLVYTSYNCLNFIYIYIY